MLRSLLLWIGVRLFVLMGGAVVGELLLRVTALSAAIIIVVSVFLTLATLTRRREALFLANLGVRTSTILMLAAIPACLGEIAVALWAP